MPSSRNSFVQPRRLSFTSIRRRRFLSLLILIPLFSVSREGFEDRSAEDTEYKPAGVLDYAADKKGGLLCMVSKAPGRETAWIECAENVHTNDSGNETMHRMPAAFQFPLSRSQCPWAIEDPAEIGHLHFWPLIIPIWQLIFKRD